MPPKNSAPATKAATPPVEPAIEQVVEKSDVVEVQPHIEPDVEPPVVAAIPPELAALMAPPGCTYVRHPEGIGCTLEGIELQPKEDGSVLVPLRAVEILAGHGFEQVR